MPTEFVTRDKRLVVIRAIQPSDAAGLVSMYNQMSERTRQLRFHTYVTDLPPERLLENAIALTTLDPQRQVALVALYKQDSQLEIVGEARFSRASHTDTQAEAAVVVRDDFQRAGLGTRLLIHLAHIGRKMGLDTFYAWVRADNRPVFLLLERAGLKVKTQTSMGETYLVVFLTDLPSLP